MGRTTSRAIDHVIEKKLNSGKAIDSGIKNLYSYSKFIAQKKQEFHTYCFQVEGLLGQESLEQKVDGYDNKFYNFYDNKIKKTQCKFNLLKLFKPGELLTSIARYQK